MLSVVLSESILNLPHKRRLLLTSTGFDNKNLEKIFLRYVNKPPQKIKALFIPTAANDAESRSIIPDCKRDLTNCGIQEKNITEYDFEREMSLEEMLFNDCCYFCGGSETYLIKKINKEPGFRLRLISAIDSGLFIIGVSAGSMIFSSSVRGSIPILKNKLEPHCEENITPDGPIINSPKADINLSDEQAVLILGNKIKIIS